MNRFQIKHLTYYYYPNFVTESFAELRLCPPTTHNQSLLQRTLHLTPSASVNSYSDHYGNHVDFFSIASRHQEMKVLSQCEVEVTTPSYVSFASTVIEAQHCFQNLKSDYFDFLASTPLVPLGKPFQRFITKWFPPSKSLGEALFDLNLAIYKQFHYQPGVTDIQTNATQIAKNKQGVCQDFAHFMLAVLRTAQIPARYVSGYIESSSSSQPDLIGAEASHAWVEVLLPDQTWMGYDPTNGIFTVDRHIKLAIGRDYADVAPFRGTYRGIPSPQPIVKVEVKRLNPTKN